MRVGEDDFGNFTAKVLEDGSTLIHYSDTVVPPYVGRVSVVVKTRWSNERHEEMGFSHFLEHVLGRVGAELSGVSRFDNEYDTKHTYTKTACNHTLFSFDVSTKDEIRDAIKIFGAIANKAKIQQQHINLESDPIKIELLDRMDNSCFTLADFVDACVYGEIDISGEPRCMSWWFLERLSSILAEDLNSFYAKWYTSNNMALIFVGNCQLEDVGKIVESHFVGDKHRPGVLVGHGAAGHGEAAGPIIKSITTDRISSGATWVFRRRKSALKEPEDLCQRWEMKSNWNAYRKMLLRRRKFDDNISVVFQERGLDDLYMFSFKPVPQLSDIEILLKLFRQVLRLGQEPFPPEWIQECREDIVKEVEDARAKYSKDCRFRIDLLMTKLLGHFLYGDSVSSPKRDSTLARCWLESCKDSTGIALSFLKSSVAQSWLLVNNLEVSNKRILRILQRALNRLTKRWKCIGQNDFSQYIDLLHQVCNNKVIKLLAHHEAIAVKEWELPNGMRLAFQRSDSCDQCNILGFAVGGLAESSEDLYRSHRHVETVAFLYDLSGLDFGIKRTTMNTRTIITRHRREFALSFESSDLETAMQLIFNLFYKNFVPEEPGDIAIQCLRRSISSSYFWRDKVTQYAAGESYIYQIPTIEDLEKLDIVEACKYFGVCFREPRQFTIVIAGNLEEDTVVDMAKKYLGSIPTDRKSSASFFPSDPRELKRIPVRFPEKQMRIQENSSSVQLTEAYVCFPIRLAKQTLEWDKLFLKHVETLMRQRLLRHLRIKLGKVYSVDSDLMYDDQWYCSPGNNTALMTICFRYLDDKDKPWKLVDSAVQEIDRLRLEGLTLAEMQAVKARDVSSNTVSVSKLREAYISPLFDGNLQDTYKAREEMHVQVTALEMEDWSSHLKRLLPSECLKHSVCVLFRPDDVG